MLWDKLQRLIPVPVAGITLHILPRPATIRLAQLFFGKEACHPPTAAQRRVRILTRLNSAGAPLSASTLAAELGVSRQIVVGDVALLRAGGAQIDATPRGYQLHPAEKGYTGILACVHRTQEEMRRELYTVVDQGGTVVDVAVENSLYGEIRATLNLCNRYDVDNFIRQAADAPESLLSRMTGGVHLHTLRCPDKDTFARIRAALEQQGLLYRKE